MRPPSTRPRGTSRRCRRGGSRARARRPGPPCPCRRPTGRRSRRSAACRGSQSASVTCAIGDDAPRAPRRSASLLLVLIARRHGRGFAALPYVDAASFIVRAANLTDGVPRTDRRAGARHAVDAEPICRRSPTRHGAGAGTPLSGRAALSRARCCSCPGVHMDGIDETRLVGMAEDLAATGYAVLTVAPPDLQQFRITPENTDIIEDAARVAGRRSRTLAPGRQGRHARHQLLGRALDRRRRPAGAARSRRVRDVVRRPRRSAARDALPLLRQRAGAPPPARPRPTSPAPSTSTIQPPHDYGVTVVLLTFADRVVPAEQVRAAARRHRHLPARVVARPGRHEAGRSGVRPRAATTRPRSPSRRAR